MSSTKATLAKVAALAGVSKSQASDALRGSGRVSAESRRKVLAAAQQLGYRADSSARSLRSGSTRLVAIHLDAASTQDGEGGLLPFWSRFLTGFAGTVESYGYRTVFDISSEHDQMFDLPTSAVIFVSTTTMSVEVPTNSGFGRVVSFFGSRHLTSATHATLIDCRHDYQQIGRDAAERFINAGASRVLVLRRPGTHEYQDVIEDQLCKTLSEVDITVLSRQSDGSPEGQAAMVADALNAEPIDAVFNLGGRLSSVVAALADAGRTTSAVTDSGVVVINQADTLGDQIDLGVVTLLKLNGVQMGEDLAEHVVAAISGRPSEVVVFRHDFEQVDQR